MSSEVLSPQVAIPPFWQRLNKFFLLPLQKEPVVYALCLAVSSLFLSDGEETTMLDALIVLVKLFVVARYAFKIAAFSSYGVFNLHESPLVEDENFGRLPWLFVAAVFVQMLALGFVSHAIPGIEVLGLMLLAVAVPATLMVLIKERNLAAAINPQELWRCIAGIGWPYLVLVGFTFLLVQSNDVAAELLEEVVPKVVLQPTLTLAFAYFSWVIAALIGYTMYQYHQTLDIDVVNEYTGEEEVRQPLSAAREEARQRDVTVSRMVQQGELPGAVAQARQWVDECPESLADHRRYHRVLLLGTESAELQRHGQHFIQLLMKNRAYAEALQVYKDCAHKAPGYVPDSAAVTWVLAKDAWKTHDSALVLQLLRGFDRRFPGHPLVPEVYALIARALHQGLGKREQALAVLRGLQRRYPKHPSTLEVERMLAAPPSMAAAPKVRPRI